ncbi:Fasciclin-like arabinogalactan protein [Musa troglodytarum]|uniref:Fasciclin-like arabinogalactan protein n=1 Tax=Musa troglodytarum TaxID=320322 RepID=A0A9E7L637_9LILI|nr:Fasciclin-like arabinogalactan protein [Musa troglodytarum]
MHVHPTLSTAQYLRHAPVHDKTFSPSLLRKNISNRTPKRRLPPHASSTTTSSDEGGVEVNKPKGSVGARLRSAARNRSIKEFTGTISEEWRYYSSSIPIHSLPMEVLQMLYCFMVRNGGMLLIQPTEDSGVDIGIKWTASLAEHLLPLAFGCSINTTQVYKGTVLLRNAKNIVDSLIRMQLTQGHSGDEHQLTSPAATQHTSRSFNLKLDCPTSLEFVHLLYPGHTAVPPTPPAPFLPPSPAPAPAPAPHFVNLTELLSVAGPFRTFLGYLRQTRVIETFQNQANNTKQGITIFVPEDSAFASLKKSDLGNLTQDQLRILFLYHAFPKYYSLSDFKDLSNLNSVSTFAGGQYAVNITYTFGLIGIGSDWANPKITSSVYSTTPVAVYEIDGVLLPLAIFSSDPPLVPAPAPAPEATKTSDITPTRSAIGAAPRTSESSTSGIGSSYIASVPLLNCFVVALSGSLMLVL